MLAGLPPTVNQIGAAQENGVGRAAKAVQPLLDYFYRDPEILGELVLAAKHDAGVKYSLIARGG